MQLHAISNSISARQRWTESHYITLSIISHLFEELNLTEKKEVSRDLKPNIIKKYGEHLEKLILTITETMNPLSLDLNKDTLFNIGLGEVATSFLLYATDIGNRAREEFIEKCKNNPRRFQDRVKKQKIYSFAKEGANFKLTNNKIMRVKMGHDLFESI